MTTKTASKYSPPNSRIGDNPFNPVYVKDCKIGKCYVYKHFGVVRCVDISESETQTAGTIKTVTLMRERGSTGLFHIPCSRLAESGLRELSDAKTMDAALKKVASRQQDNRLLSPKFQFLKAALDTVLVEGNPYVLAEIICRSYGRDRYIEDRESSVIQYGNKAIELLAEEYAQVKNTDFEEAEALIAAKAGKHENKPTKYWKKKAALEANI